MTALSNFLEDELLDHVFRNAAYTSPTTVYLALFTSDPGDADSGTEVSGSGYSREVLSFGASSSGTVTIDTDVSFTASGGNFGTVTHVGIYDASTGGNLLAHGSLSASKDVNDGDTLTFEAANNDLQISLD